jgi:predicted RNA binding protein YcfA (HicA-like mRNA interferase family)
MKLDAIIRNAGFRLERQRKHKIYKHAELGETLVVASTPSDHRTGANTLAQLSRLTGIRKRELIAPPVRGARRNEHKVENLPVPPKDPPVEIVPEVQPTAPTPMTPAERKYLKRMEKHEIQRQLKLGRQRQRLQAALDRCHEFFIHEMFESGAVHCEDEREDLHDLTALSLYFAVKARMGFHDVELMAAEVLINQTVGNIPVVRVGCWYLDYFGGEVHDTTE